MYGKWADLESKYNRVESNKAPSLSTCRKFKSYNNNEENPTFKNILHSQYDSKVLPEHYCSLSGSHYLLTSQNKILLKGFLHKVFRISPNTTQKITINLQKLLCVQDTKSKNNFENQNWLSRVSIYELNVMIFILYFSRKYSGTQQWWGNIISTTGGL